ncbi:AMP-binding protein [Nocardia carnea]|uniref:AMP-binding protein n=1 Tax=Nocardia carnea TaxID=37328 RepID=A0ABW7TYT6_9NOCA|nr:AMP-binding protein [Nocardia carnea]
MTRIVPDDLRQRYESAGWWTRDTMGDLLSRSLAAAPGTVFRVYSDIRPWQGTFADVERLARRLAAGLRDRGVGPGDVIAFQLPNWMEAAATFWAASFLGAAVVPVVHFYGPAELAHILRVSRPKVFITMAEFGTRTHDPELSADVPIVGVVGGDFDELLAADPMPGVLPADPAGPALIAFTSGTTSAPKGVVHSHQTLGCETLQLAERNRDDRGEQLTATPVGHFIGMVGALLLPVLHGRPVHMLDVWDPGRALALMKDRGLVVGGGPPYFVTSMVEHSDYTPEHLAHMKYVGLGGSAVPAAVTRMLTELGVVAFRAYGSTEHPSITASALDAPPRERLDTDGRVMPGVEIRIASDGEILSRGPDLCLGYTDPDLTARVFDDEGWYHTGDIGVLDPSGCLTITDRKADVIIRGGENVGAREVEDVLDAMPQVAESVVIALPDSRFGEVVGAVLRLNPGCVLPSRAEVRAFFERAGVARQKLPARLFEATDFPRTPSGKIQKHLVRKGIAASILRE